MLGVSYTNHSSDGRKWGHSRCWLALRFSLWRCLRPRHSRRQEALLRCWNGPVPDLVQEGRLRIRICSFEFEFNQNMLIESQMGQVEIAKLWAKLPFFKSSISLLWPKRLSADLLVYEYEKKPKSSRERRFFCGYLRVHLLKGPGLQEFGRFLAPTRFKIQDSANRDWKMSYLAIS